VILYGCRYIQRCPLAILKSDIIAPLIQCATQATQLDHREANVSVMKFLYDMVHTGRRQKDSQDFTERQALVKGILIQTAPQLLYMVIYGVIFNLPTYTMNDISELIYEIKEVMPQESSKWVEDALKQLPNQTAVGSQTATLEQLEIFHKQVMG
jgi:transportin-3